jgi:hypothetical protein
VARHLLHCRGLADGASSGAERAQTARWVSGQTDGAKTPVHAVRRVEVVLVVPRDLQRLDQHQALYNTTSRDL